MTQGKIMLMALVAVIGLAGCTTQSTNTDSDSNTADQGVVDEYIVDESDFIDANELLEQDQQSTLSEQEIAGIMQMREEEKLARDVYNTLADAWGIKIFSNIARSEQTHTDAVKALIDKYELEDPVVSDERGVFTSVEMKNLYEELVEKGFRSNSAALEVGATVEDLDIYDLEVLMAQTENEDIIAVYQNLQKGSRNHLRAFNRQIEQKGGTYQPQYISEQQFAEIISAEQERGNIK